MSDFFDADKDIEFDSEGDAFRITTTTTAPQTTEALIQRAYDHVASGRSMPLSSSVIVARDEMLDLLEMARERLPGEVRDARWLLKERDDFLAKCQREANEIMDDARSEAQKMVQRTEIVRQANQVAQRILEDAREEARRLRHSAEDYCDQKLAAFEIVLDRTIKTVKAGRAKLSVTPALTGLVAGAEENNQAEVDQSHKQVGEERFFDQDIE
ncbi:MAG: ATP synthase F0 subunit B [Acidimicrobiales bacterium]